jgi:hypothetical protein
MPARDHTTDEDRAKNLALKSQAASQPLNAYSRGEIAVFGGKLFTVAVETTRRKGTTDCFIFITSRAEHYFTNAQEMTRFFDSTQTRPSFFGFMTELMTIERASSVLVIALTIAVCYTAVVYRDVPQVLSNALTTIVGFFFGSKLSQRRAPGG